MVLVCYEELFIKMTNIVSEESDDGNRKVGCVIVKGDTIISYGSNTIPEKVKKLIKKKFRIIFRL